MKNVSRLILVGMLVGAVCVAGCSSNHAKSTGIKGYRPAIPGYPASPNSVAADTPMPTMVAPPSTPPPMPARQVPIPTPNTESYDQIHDNEYQRVVDAPLSTFSIDVDTASYANVRRFLNDGTLPPKDAVRVEEFINYFSYDYPQPTDDKPFSVVANLVECPWNKEHTLARIALRGKELPKEDARPSNLVFLIDVSGSMADEDKLPLVQRSMTFLLDGLGHRDRVAIVVYAGASGLVLPSTSCDKKQAIRDAIGNLSAGGSTNGGEGIQLAYKVAEENFREHGNNRVILATDGDFNVGITDHDQLTKLIEEKRKTGIFLTTLGFGGGNYQDPTLEQLADKGNGNCSYIDSFNEAKKVFGTQLTGTLFTIAKDVKIQVEFNPAKVAEYRLIGYENRVLADKDFNDDTKDAGEIGAGHTVTALYELTPVGRGASETKPAVDPLKYQDKPALAEAASGKEVMTVKLRYKLPKSDESTLIVLPVEERVEWFANAPVDMKFASAVAAFGMLLRDSPHKGNATYDMVIDAAKAGMGEDTFGYRAEFVSLVHKAKGVKVN